MPQSRCSPSRAMHGTCTCRRHIAAARTRVAILEAAIETAPSEAEARSLADELHELMAALGDV
jgi:hypothetical protein